MWFFILPPPSPSHKSSAKFPYQCFSLPLTITNTNYAIIISISMNSFLPIYIRANSRNFLHFVVFSECKSKAQIININSMFFRFNFVVYVLYGTYFLETITISIFSHLVTIRDKCWRYTSQTILGHCPKALNIFWGIKKFSDIRLEI